MAVQRWMGLLSVGRAWHDRSDRFDSFTLRQNLNEAVSFEFHTLPGTIANIVSTRREKSPLIVSKRVLDITSGDRASGSMKSSKRKRKYGLGRRVRWHARSDKGSWAKA